MAVVPRSSAGAQPPRHGATPAARSRLYGISGDEADIGGGALSKISRRGVENIHRTTSVVYHGDADDGGGSGGGGGLRSWCACLTGGSAVASPPVAMRGGPGSRGSGFGCSGGMGYGAVVVVTDGFEGRRRSFASPGKVTPVLEGVSSLSDAEELVREAQGGVLYMSNLGTSSGRNALHAVDSGVLSSSLAIDPGDSNRSTKASPSASPTLLEVMSREAELQDAKPGRSISLSQQLTFQENMKSFLSGTSPGSKFNDSATGDIELTLHNQEGYSVTVHVHRRILFEHSRFFAAMLSDRWQKQQWVNTSNVIEITDIDDVEIYLETLRLMYCQDVRRSLIKENVSRVLDILKLSAKIVFEAGVHACLEYLEAVPWTEDEEEKVTALLAQLQLESVGVAADVMKRCSALEDSNSEDVLVRLLNSALVTNGTDDKGRREMRALVSRMLRENDAHKNKNTDDVSLKESLYRACQGCLDSLIELVKAQGKDGGYDREMLVEISRLADNLQWLVDILIDRRVADDFIRMWAHHAELAHLHAGVPVMNRYQISCLTARLCIAIGKGQVLCPKDVRFLLLQTWLQPLVDDFAWMQRCCRTLDKKMVEEGISQTILTLPLNQQQGILLSWFDRFSVSGDECPNLQKAFEVWWRRAFTRPSVVASSKQCQDLER